MAKRGPEFAGAFGCGQVVLHVLRLEIRAVPQSGRLEMMVVEGRQFRLLRAPLVRLGGVPQDALKLRAILVQDSAAMAQGLRRVQQPHRAPAGGLMVRVRSVLTQPFTADGHQEQKFRVPLRQALGLLAIDPRSVEGIVRFAGQRRAVQAHGVRRQGEAGAQVGVPLGLGNRLPCPGFLGSSPTPQIAQDVVLRLVRGFLELVQPGLRLLTLERGMHQRGEDARQEQQQDHAVQQPGPRRFPLVEQPVPLPPGMAARANRLVATEPAQVVRQLFGRRVAAVGIVLEALQADGRQVGVQTHRQPLQDRIQRLLRLRGACGRFAGQHGAQRRAQTEDIASHRRIARVPRLFRGHVPEGPGPIGVGDAALVAVPAKRLGQPEIGDSRPTGFVGRRGGFFHQDVVRFDVPMDVAAGMGVSHSAGRLFHVPRRRLAAFPAERFQPKRLGPAQVPSSSRGCGGVPVRRSERGAIGIVRAHLGGPQRRHRLQRAHSRDVLHAVIQPPRRLAGVIDRHDVRVLQPRGRLQLLAESPDRLGPCFVRAVGQEFRADQLQRHDPLGELLFRLPNDSHAALADLLDQAISADFAACVQRRPCRFVESLVRWQRRRGALQPVEQLRRAARQGLRHQVAIVGIHSGAS